MLSPVKSASTRSVCVIGNSHAAAIKQAWDRSDFARPEGLSLDFFAKGNSALEDMVPRDGKLVPSTKKAERMMRATAGGSTEIDIAKYDAFILVGLRFGINIAQICGEFGTTEDLKAGPLDYTVSDRCFSACLRQQLDESLAMTFARWIRALSSVPILILTVPLPIAAMLTHEEGPDHPGFQKPAFLENLMSRCKAVADQVAAEQKAEVVWQDEATTEKSGFTKTVFSLGAARHKSHREKEEMDWFHRNSDYGVIMLSKAFRRLGEIA